MSTTDILDLVKKVKSEMPAGAFSPVEEKSLVYDQQQGSETVDYSSLTPAARDVLRLVGKIKQGPVAVESTAAGGSNDSHLSPKYDGREAERIADEAATAKGQENIAKRSEFTRGLLRGIDQTQATFYGGLGMLSSAMGDDKASDMRFQQYREQMRQASENPATVDEFFSTDPKKGAFGSVGNLGTYVAGTMGSLLPTIAESAVAGVAGAAIGGAIVPAPDPTDVVAVPVGFVGGVLGRGAMKKAIAETAERYVARGVAAEAAQQMGERAVKSALAKRIGATIGTSQITALQEGGGMYAEGREAGYDNPWSAILLGQVSGASEGVLGNVPFALRTFIGKTPIREAAQKFGTKEAAGLLWDAVKNAGEEAVQESFQEFLGDVNSSINDPSEKIFTKENFKQWAESGAAGALAGGILGGGGVATQAALDARRRQLEELRAKGFISKEEAKDNGIEGSTRREIMGNAEQELADLNEVEFLAKQESDLNFIRQQQAQAPQPQAGVQPEQMGAGSQVDEDGELLPQASQADLDREFAERMAAQGGNVSTSTPTDAATVPPVVQQPTVQPPQVQPQQPTAVQPSQAPGAIEPGDISTAINALGRGAVDGLYIKIWNDVQSGNLQKMDKPPLFEQLVLRGYNGGVVRSLEDVRSIQDGMTGDFETDKAVGINNLIKLASKYQEQQPAAVQPPVPQPPQVPPAAPTVQPQPTPSVAQQTPASFAARMARGEQMTSPEDQQYRINNAAEIEAELQKLVPPTVAPATAPLTDREFAERKAATEINGKTVEQMRNEGMSEDEIQEEESKQNYFNVVGDVAKASDKDLNRAYGFSGRLADYHDRKGQSDMAESVRREQESMKAEIKRRNAQEEQEPEPPAPSKLLDELESIEELRAVLENWSADDKRPKNSYSLKELIDLARSRLQDFKLESGNELAEDLAGQNGEDAKKYAIRQKNQIKAWIQVADREDTLQGLENDRAFSESFIKIVADDVSKIRKQDVYRLLSEVPSDRAGYFENWLSKRRPDLASDITTASNEILLERSKENQPAPPSGIASAESDMDAAMREEFKRQLGEKDDKQPPKKRPPRKDGKSKKPSSLKKSKGKARKEADNLWDELIKKSQNKLLTGLDPELLTIAAKIAIKELEYSAISFAEFVERSVAKVPDALLEKLKPYLESAWRTAYDSEMTTDAGGKFDDYIKKPQQPNQEQPEPKKPEPKEQPEAEKESEVDKTLRQAGLNVEKLADGTWQITGNTYEHSKEIGDVKREIRELGGYWDKTGKRWTFKADPRRAIADRLVSKGVGAEPSDEGVSDEQMARERARRAEDEKPDVQTASESYVASVDQSTRDLIGRGLKFGMTEEVVSNQIEDVGRVVNAAENGRPMFVIGSAPGTGKTFVLGGVIRELRKRGFKKFVYVTQNQDLVLQVQTNLADYGLEGVEFVTYTKARTAPPSTSGAVLLLDEAHSAKNLDRETGKKLSSMVQSSDFTVYATATPFENVTEAEYIGYSGIFDDLKVQFNRPSNKPGGRPFRNELYGFKAWAWMFGANVYFVKQEDRNGETRFVPVVWWDKQQTSEEDQLAANEWLKKRGVYVQRPMALPVGMVNSELRSIEADPYWADISNQVVGIYADAESEAESNVERGQIKAHKANVLKRLLEASKVDAAIARAKELIGKGETNDPQVIIFVNTKADTDIGTYTLSEPYRKEYGIKGKDAKRRYTPSEMDEMMQRWYEAKAIAKEMGDNAGPPPFAPFVHKIAMAMDAAGVMEKFPSVIDKIMDAFPGQAVEYSGRTASQNSDNLAKWKNNEAKLIVATMDKGGTGLSFHDTTGKMPSRYQVNMNLPWSGTKVEQVSGRLARYGTAKPVNIEWLFASNIPFDRELSKTVGSRMRSMSAAVQGRKSGDAKRIRDFDFEESPVVDDNVAVAPWSDAAVEDEGRWAGTSVNVSAKGKEEGYAGKVVRVLNKGETIEVQRDGFDAAIRVPAERVSIVDLVDSKLEPVQPSEEKPVPKKSKRSKRLSVGDTVTDKDGSQITIKEVVHKNWGLAEAGKQFVLVNLNNGETFERGSRERMLERMRLAGLGAEEPSKPSASVFSDDVESVPIVTEDQIGGGSDGTYDQMHSGLASKLVQQKMALGMRGINGREYGVFEHSEGKWQLVSRPMAKPEQQDAASQMHYPDGSAYRQWMSRRHTIGDSPTSYLSGHSSASVREAAKQNPGLGLVITPANPSYVGHAGDYSHIMIDNGAFSEFTGKAPFSEEKFFALLDSVVAAGLKDKVQFVVVPDKVGSWSGTNERWEEFSERVRAYGMPLAYVGQDGVEQHLDEMPWDEFDVFFIGGSTPWKLGYDPNGDYKDINRPTDDELRKAGVLKGHLDLIKEARRRGKKIHMGRVNSWKRMEIANYGMRVGSADGNYIGAAPDKNLPVVLDWLRGTGGDQFLARHELLLNRAAPYVEKGESYKRDIADPAMRLRTAIAKGNAIDSSLVQTLTDELEVILDYWEPLLGKLNVTQVINETWGNEQTLDKAVERQYQADRMPIIGKAMQEAKTWYQTQDESLDDKIQAWLDGGELPTRVHGDSSGMPMDLGNGAAVRKRAQSLANKLGVGVAIVQHAKTFKAFFVELPVSSVEGKIYGSQVPLDFDKDFESVGAVAPDAGKEKKTNLDKINDELLGITTEKIKDDLIAKAAENLRSEVQPKQSEVKDEARDQEDEERPDAGTVGQDRRAISEYGVKGKPASVITADKSTRRATYYAVEADSLIPSHDARKNFAKNEGSLENERPYEDPKEGAGSRQTVRDIAEVDKKKKYLLTSDTMSPIDGPPIVDLYGRVLGGNARSMGMQLAYAGPNAEILRSHMRAEGVKFEIPQDQLDALKNPVIIRVMEEPFDENTISSLLNDSLAAAKSQATVVVSQSKRLSEDTIDLVASILGAEAEPSLREVMANPRQSTRIVQAIVRDGAWSDKDIAVYVDPGTGDLTAEGKLAIENMLVARVIPNVSLLGDVAPSVKQKILSAIGPLTKGLANEKFGKQLLDDLIAAIEAYDGYIAERKTNSLQSYFFEQKQMFPVPGHGNVTVAGIVHALAEFTPTKFRNAMRDVVESLGIGERTLSLFGDDITYDTIEDAVRNVINPPLRRDPDVLMQLDDKITDPPQSLFQSDPDIDANIRSKAMDLGIAANKAGITDFEDFVKYSLERNGEKLTRYMGAYLAMVGKAVGMTGIRPVKDILGVPMTQAEYVQLGKETFASVPAEQVEAGIEAAMLTGLPQMAVGFAPAGSPVPGRKTREVLTQGDFDQPADYEFTESDYRPAVVAYARDKWGGEVAANGKPTWQNFVRWFDDSAVVDKDGNPLVVYHGGARTIDNDIVRTPFFYMTANRSEAEYWAGEGGRVHEVYLKFTKPYRDSQHDDRFMDMTDLADFEEREMDDPEFAEQLREGTRQAVDRMNELKGQGYNSIVMQGELNENFDNYIAFDSTQIKSAIANVGTFDPNNLNMLYQEEASDIDSPDMDQQGKYSAPAADVVERLNAGKKIKLYRAMLLIDGKLYPPMSSRSKDETGKLAMRPDEPVGQWMQSEEKPDLVPKTGKNAGKFPLQKPKGVTWAAYAPYFHASPMPLNDQFTASWLNDGVKRPRMVIVEVEVPASEMTSGYQAEGSTKQVGANKWNAGVVASKLPGGREVVLSRYLRITRIVPDSEVAKKIASIVNPAGLSIPENVVTPQLRAELEKNGVSISPKGTRGEAIRFAIGAEQERQGKEASKKDLKHVNWSRLSQLGETLNPNEAGYIKPDGSLADFSGKREGGQPGTRSFDHREAGGTAGMQEVIAYGWVRMDENSGSLDIAKMPTPAQLSAITRMAQRKFGEIVLDLEDGLGEWRETDEYYSNPRRRWSQQYPEGTKPQRILNDIKRFFGGDTPNALFQQQSQGGNVKGWTKFISGTRALIGATSKADISTVIHEFAHPIRRFLLARNVPQDQRLDITDAEIEMLEKKCGAGSVIDGKWVTNWDVASEEKFAKMWEQYFFEGKSPNTLLDSLFEKISRWMQQVYQSAMDITGGTLDPEVRKLFDKLVQRQLPADQRTDTRSRDEGAPPVPPQRQAMQQADDDNLTSVANAYALETRMILGLPGFADVTKETFQEWIDQALQILRKDPTYANRLVKELAQSNRNIDKIETAVLELHLRSLKNLSDAASDRLFAAVDAKDDVAAVQARRESDMLINEIEEITDVTNRVGTEQGRSLAARKIVLRNDFTLAGLRRTARIANAGQPLNEEQSKQIEELAKQIAKLEGDLAKETQEKDDLARQLAAKESIDDTQKQVGKPVRNTATNRAVKKVESFVSKFVNIFGKRDDTTTLQQTEDEQMAEDGEEVIKSFVEAGVYSFGEFMSKFKAVIKGDVPVAARVALRKAWDKMKAQGDIPAPDMSDERQTAELRRLAKMVERNLVEFGITDPEEVIDGVHEALQEVFEDVTQREAMDAMSGYGQYSTPSQEPNDKIIRDLNAQFQQMAKLDDMKQGIAPKKSGRGRDEPSPELRELIREVNEMKRNSKYFVTDPEAQLKTIFQATRTALRNRIYDLDKALNVTKEPIPGRTPNTFEGEQAEEIESLRKQRDELMASYKATFPKPGLTFEQRAAIAERAIDRAITEIESQLATGDIAPKRRAEPISTPTLEAKRMRLEALRATREAAREMQKPKLTEEEIADREKRRAEKAYIANLLNRIADYEDRKRQGYFGPKPKKEPRDLSPREIELSRQLVNLKDEFFRYAAEYRLKNMGRVERAWDNTKETMNLSRAIMTSFDLSAVFRQGGIASLAHPKLMAAASQEMWGALRSQDAEFDTMDKIENDVLYAFAMQCGLPITTDKGKIQRQEEAYAGRMVKYGIGKKGTKLNTWSKWALTPVTASGRAYTTFLNSMRFRLFKYMVSNLGAGGAVTVDEGKVIASYISAATGRADLGKFNQAAANLNTVFFAPRYVASRFQYLAMPFYLLPSTKVSGRVKKMIAMEYARHAMGLAAFLGLSVALAGLLTDDEEEKPTVEFDPRSSDFMKLKIGDTRIDPMAGLSQTVTLIGQMTTGQKKGLRGDIKDLYGENRKFGDPDLWDVGTGFLRKKLAPIPGAIVDLRVGENVIGEKETVLSATTDLFVPLSFQEAGETMKARGLVGGSVVTALSLLGMGGGTYGPKTQYATADAAKREELFRKDLENVKWNDPDLAYKDFLTTTQVDKFNKQREGRKQSLVFSAAADPKRKDYNSDETFKKSVEERDKALDAVIKAGMGPKEVQLLLIAYYKRNYGSAYETRGGVYQMKESLANRLRAIRRKLNEQK